MPWSTEFSFGSELGLSPRRLSLTLRFRFSFDSQLGPTLRFRFLFDNELGLTLRFRFSLRSFPFGLTLRFCLSFRSFTFGPTLVGHSRRVFSGLP